VYPAEFEYFAPRTVAETLALLAEHGDEAKILAGGQSLVPMMKLRLASPRVLVDINGVAGLDGCDVDGDRLVMGALCRHADVLAAPVVRERLPLMHDAARQTADVQVRNRGTVAGSLAHADPAGDWPAALLALEAEVTIAGAHGARTLPLGEFIVDAYTTQLEPGELITRVAVPLPPPRSGGAYAKFEKRAGDFAVASVGVQVTLGADGRCVAARISLGAVGARPIRAAAAEGLLRDADRPADALAAAARLVAAAAEPFADTRGSEEYKRHLAGVLFQRAAAAAFDRARGHEVATLHV
jgi:carbon-monoxide dehydrogenase medium subunit